LIIGALVLFNSPGTPRFLRVSVPLVIFVSLLTGGIFFVMLGYAIRAQFTPVRTGQESLVGRTGMAKTTIAPLGGEQRENLVQVGGELWSAELAEGEAMLPTGTRVEVVRVDGLHVVVRALNNRTEQNINPKRG
jgi:membrane-bound serine protease (ClpP class)